MTLARLTTKRATEYELVRVLYDGSFVLRDAFRDTRVFEESSHRERVEIRCDRCGRWSTDAGPATEELWECFGGTCDRSGQEMATK